MQGRSGSWFSTRTLLPTLCGGLFIAAAADLWHFGAGALLWERKLSITEQQDGSASFYQVYQDVPLPGLPGSTRFYQGPPGYQSLCQARSKGGAIVGWLAQRGGTSADLHLEVRPQDWTHEPGWVADRVRRGENETPLAG